MNTKPSTEKAVAESAPQALPPLHPNHLSDLRYVAQTLQRVLLTISAKHAHREEVAASMNAMRYIIKRTEEATPALEGVDTAAQEEEIDRLKADARRYQGLKASMQLASENLLVFYDDEMNNLWPVELIDLDKSVDGAIDRAALASQEK